jgi:hypothetical protein
VKPCRKRSRPASSESSLGLVEDLPIDLSGLIEEFVVAGEPLVPPILIEVSVLDDQRWEVPHPITAKTPGQPQPPPQLRTSVQAETRRSR